MTKKVIELEMDIPEIDKLEELISKHYEIINALRLNVCAIAEISLALKGKAKK